MKPAVMKPLRFGSAFADIFTEYIETNRSVGKKYNCDAGCLELFDRWCQKEGVSKSSFTREIYGQWCEKCANENATTQHIRIAAVNRAVNYLRNHSYCDFTPIPAPRVFRSYVPHIYTKEELHDFFSASDEMKPHAAVPLAHKLFPLLFRMIYCCGLRVSEALNLRLSDVDLKNGILIVLGAKHDKDRLIPMSGSLNQLCREYADKTLPVNSIYFFPAPDGNRLSNNTVYCRFRELLRKSGISHGGRGKGPRVHDFRHTFAVHRLAEWSKSGIDIYTTIPILSVYLGHYDIAATQYYLRLTAEVFPEMMSMFLKHFQNVFQEVSHENP